jgi:mRNA interferase RelE/StbE
MTSERNLGWRVTVHKAAEKALRKLPKNLAARLVETLERLPGNPVPVGAAPLKGMSDVCRVRVGDYRIAYSLNRTNRQILVTHIGHRKHVYRNL